MYNGPYQTVRQLEERVEEVDDPLESLKVGSMVAVLLSNYRKFPVIGEVLAIDGENFQIHYWEGTYLSNWCPHMVRKKGCKEVYPWTDCLPQRSIILSNFVLEDNKLTRGQRSYLKNKYKEFENLRSG